MAGETDDSCPEDGGVGQGGVSDSMVLEAFVDGTLAGAADAEDGSGEGKIRCAGDLEIARIAGEDFDGFAQSLDQAGIVGAGEIVLGVGALKEIAGEDLRRLDHNHVAPIN